MSNNLKTIIVIIAVIIVLGGIYYFTTQQGSTIPSEAPTADMVASTSGPSALPTTQSSNAALNQDLSAIDSQLSGLNTDAANANQSLNDQPVSQSSL